MKEIVNENASKIETAMTLLSEVPEEGLHMRQLAQLNESSTGFAALLGLRFTEVTPTCVKAEMPVSDAHLQVSGVVNGGVYCGIAESVGSIMGIIAAKGKVVLGVNNNTDFLSSVPAGVISAEATVIRNGRNTQLINVEMYHRDKLVARTTLRTMLAPAPVEGNPGRPEDKFSV